MSSTRLFGIREDIGSTGCDERDSDNRTTHTNATGGDQNFSLFFRPRGFLRMIRSPLSCICSCSTRDVPIREATTVDYDPEFEISRIPVFPNTSRIRRETEDLSRAPTPTADVERLSIKPKILPIIIT